MEKPLISFDFAIKYLLKNKGDYDIIEGFISALFASQGYPPIKINALLDTESNKEELELKKYKGYNYLVLRYQTLKGSYTENKFSALNQGDHNGKIERFCQVL